MQRRRRASGDNPRHPASDPQVPNTSARPEACRGPRSGSTWPAQTGGRRRCGGRNVSTITLCDKRKAILRQEGHVLVTGGPGSGKTTVALLKAAATSHSLKPGEEILFLSFSRSAIQQILQKSHDILKRDERSLIRVQTYHAFCIELLESHGRLLSGHRCKFVVPGEERLRKAGFKDQWNAERERLASEESVFCFDLLAPGAADLLEKSAAVRTLLTSKFPMVVCDEFQDTDDDQWRIVQALAMSGTMCILADPEQRIFDYRPNVNPLRVQQLKEKLAPADFGDRKSTRLNSSHLVISYAVFCLKKKNSDQNISDISRILTNSPHFRPKVRTA